MQIAGNRENRQVRKIRKTTIIVPLRGESSLLTMNAKWKLINQITFHFVFGNIFNKVYGKVVGEPIQIGCKFSRSNALWIKTKVQFLFITLDKIRAWISPTLALKSAINRPMTSVAWRTRPKGCRFDPYGETNFCMICNLCSEKP